MSYTDNKEMTPARMWSIFVVVLIHAIIGYALVKGGYNVVKKVAADLNTFDVKDEPPPPVEPPPPPPPEQNVPPPPVVSPPPIVNTNQAPPTVITQATPPPVFVPTPEPPRPAPPPPPPAPVAKLAPKGNPGTWTSNDDYPPSAVRNEESGTTGFRLDIGADGKVTNCTITSSSGSSTLDNTTCTLLKRRAKFTPGRDSDGSSIGGVYSSRIKWVLPTN